MKMNQKRLWGLLLAALIFSAAGLAADKVVQAPNWPDPNIRDQITHNRGNIVTTVQNYGYIGGYSWAGRPSGRWPSNTDHDYLAEMKFWIGGLNQADEVLLDNTDDDFKPIPTLISGSDSYDIRLSTDSTRYDYDPADTVGSGVGYPAKGWRVWDANTRQWTYNSVYSFIDSTFYSGGPLGVQESVCRFGDDGTGSANMGLEFTQTVRQWDYSYNRDMIFFNLQITNSSTENYHDLAVALYADFDVGGPDPATGENGRLGDKVDCDTALDLAWTYDVDGYDPGWGRQVRTGFMGTVILSTPGDLGMTSFNTGQWEFLPQTDDERYAMIDNTEFDQSLPPTDQYYVQAVRGIDLPAGTTIEFNFALVAAPTDSLLRQVAYRAKALFEANYIGPKPPINPVAVGTAGDHSAKVRWDNLAETSIEPTTGGADFKGYKIFRSTDQGKSWGTLVVNPDQSIGPDFYELAFYEFDELGRIAHTYIDSTLTNGMEYWYAVCAYDTGTPNLGIGALQNPLGPPSINPHVVKVVPVDNPLGYLTPQETITHVYTGNWQESVDGVTIYVVDNTSITGNDYRVTFTEECYQTYWNLINTTTGDTVLNHQDQVDDLPNAYPVADGMQVVITNAHRTPSDAAQTSFAIPGETTIALSLIDHIDPEWGCNENFRSTFEIRFTATGSTAFNWATDAPMTVPIEFWNVTENRQVAAWIYDMGSDNEWTFAEGDLIIMTDADYDNGNFHPEYFPDGLNWYMALDPGTAQPQTGDVMTIVGANILSPEDQFDFSSDKVVSSLASANLKSAKVVPNPYIGNAVWESNPGIRRMQFTNLPATCTIRVYTLSGDLVRTIAHDNGTGAEDWNMQSETGREIAAGVYFFHIDSQYGKHTGKFAVIK